MSTEPVTRGWPHPLGARPQADGTNFSVFSRHAERLDLLLYGRADAAAPARVIPLEHHGHRSGDYWHAFVPGVAPGQIYASLAKDLEADLVVPVFFGAAEHENGVRRLWKALRHDCPWPATTAARLGISGPGTLAQSIAAEA